MGGRSALAPGERLVQQVSVRPLTTGWWPARAVKLAHAMRAMVGCAGHGQFLPPHLRPCRCAGRCQADRDNYMRH